MATETTIEPSKTLVILDKIQESPQALTALKYFCENVPDGHVACAGSLLDVALAKPSSFPVGKVDFLQLEPMSFAEFLEADGNGTLAAFPESLSELAPMPTAFQNCLDPFGATGKTSVGTQVPAFCPICANSVCVLPASFSTR